MTPDEQNNFDDDFKFPRRPSALEWAVVVMVGLFALGCLVAIFCLLYGIQLGPGG